MRVANPFTLTLTRTGASVTPEPFTPGAPRGDVLIVVPPFAATDCPSLAAHLLQACARERGFRVDVMYANLTWAGVIGESLYKAICRGAPYSELSGERLFSEAAFGLPLADPRGSAPAATEDELASEMNLSVDWQAYRDASQQASAWADDLARRIIDAGYRVVGCTVTFEQTLASIALLERIKALAPEVVTLLGGGNCQGEMAEGLASLRSRVDHIFSGESEKAFVDFLAALAQGQRPKTQIVQGSPCMNMDALPTPDFGEFFAQRQVFLPDTPLAEAELWLHCESSRGCWWGQKHPCTFCGFNGETMKFRERTPERVLRELKTLVSAHPTRKILMADNIMPHTYFRTLLPRLAEEVPGLDIYYELKANLSLAQCLALKKAGVANIQPGIESLSTPLLKRMDKGLTGPQSVRLLRYAATAGLNVSWNLLYDFPGDSPADYEETLALVPLLRHLQPPVGLHPLTIDRFSPYFMRPATYGITRLTPQQGYASVYPAHADLSKIAYHFNGEYPSGAREAPELIARLKEEVEHWREVWSSAARPLLEVRQLTEKAFFLVDRRGLEGTQEGRFLTREEAREVLMPARHPSSTTHAWALERRVAAHVDGWFVPLATAPVDLLLRLEEEAKEREAGPVTRAPGLQVLGTPPAPQGAA
nr:RiPP maturation radical SAM C-methyltransferase [Comamonas sp. JC664]